MPALAKLKLVFELELRGRGDVQIFRVELPGARRSARRWPTTRRSWSRSSARASTSSPTEGVAKDYREAYEEGQIKVSGDPGIQKLIGQVVVRHEERERPAEEGPLRRRRLRSRDR